MPESSEYILLISLGLLLMLIPLVKSLMERLGVPAFVGYIVLGFLVSTLDHHWSFISPVIDNTYAALAHLGVVALLFCVGLKSHTKVLLAKLPVASFIWIGDVPTNLFFGFIISHYFLTLSLETSLIIATAFSATSVAASVSVWDKMHKLNTSNGQLLVDVAELDELSGVLLFAILLAIIPILHGNESGLLPSLGFTTFAVILKLILFITGCYLFSHYLEPGFTRFNRNWENSTLGMTISVLGAGLAIAAIAGYLGFSLAIGALFAGLAFSRDPQAVLTNTKFVYFYEFLTPSFFIHIGMQLDPEVIIPSLGLTTILLLPAILGKFIGVAAPALRTLKSLMP